MGTKLKLEEHPQYRTLLDFATHLNTYKGLEDCRFDFMVIDFLQKNCKHEHRKWHEGKIHCAYCGDEVGGWNN